MDNNCLVSIIVPVFNVKPYLAEALESVLHQTYEHLEIILIDDGSTDGSGDLCDEYGIKDKRILVIHQENKGLSSARNAGLNIMHGEALAFLDPDDVYHLDYVSAMMAAMVRESPDIVLCKYTGHKTTDKIVYTGLEKTMPQADPGTYDRLNALRALADGSINRSVWNKLYKRKLWKDIRFPDGHVFEDVDTSYKIFNICNSVYVLDEPLYLYRIRPGSIMDTSSRKNYQDRNLAYSHFCSFIEENIPEVFSAEQLRRLRQQRLNGMIIVYLCRSGKRRSKGDITDEELRKMIIEARKEAGIENCNLRKKAFYWMLDKCPKLIPILYPVYLPVRRLVYLIIRK